MLDAHSLMSTEQSWLFALFWYPFTHVHV
jgi:hypothetical protein